MRIQHNIPAMNAYRNYNSNTKALQGNLQKLSSGYKINKAGDDAAGLAISEKMRAQITGLEVAQKNAKDGISLVQTAEGAMTEIHTMLNRMFSLAEQSANGTYDDDVDRVQLNEEFQKLTDEIDRIADATNFNGKKLLNGELDGPTDNTPADPNSVEAVAGSLKSGTTDGAKIGKVKLTFGNGATADQRKALNSDLAKAGDIKISLKTAGQSLAANDVLRVYGLPTDKYNLKIQAADGTTWLDMDKTKAFGATTSTNATDVKAAGTVKLQLSDKESGQEIGVLSFDLTTATNPYTAGENETTVNFAAPVTGTGEIESDTTQATTLSNYGIKSIDLGDLKVTDGDKITAKYNTDSKLIINVGGTDYTFDSSTATGSSQSKVDLSEATVEAVSANGDKIKITFDKDQTKIGSDGTTAVSATPQEIGTVKVGGDDDDQKTPKALRLRIGDSTESYDDIKVGIKSMKKEALADMTDVEKGGTGLTLDKLGIGYATEADATAAGVDADLNADTAMKALKGMINYVSNERGKLGATQNRLDHTINNLSTMQENIQDAEATIRDVDVAEEMMKYTKNNILVQSAQAMLAQANQLPQGVLQLLG